MLRLAEVLGSLSLATDLADGFSLEKSLRTTVIARRLAELVSTDVTAHRLAFWTALLRYTGCTAFAHEEGRDFAVGDDLSLRKTLAFVDFGRPLTFLSRAARDIAPTAALTDRARAVGRLLATPAAAVAHAKAQCDAGAAFAELTKMPEVAQALRHREERWDGKGPRAAAEGESLPLSARIADVADVAELFAWSFGPQNAIDELKRRRGGQLEPRLVDLFLEHMPELCEGVFGPSVWELFLDSEPAPWRVAQSFGEVNVALEAFSRFADVGSVYTLGHSGAVAELAERAARAAGLSEEDCGLALQAGLTHDLGRVAVPVGIWEKKGELTPYERERVRSHSQHTETILRLAPGLSAVADVASLTHERGSGRGYHRRLSASGLPPIARILAAADVAVALGSDRPHRRRRSRGEVQRELRSMVHGGELDASAVESVLSAAGHPRPARGAIPLGLSARELEVVRLVAVGRTNPEIGKLLGISPRTAQKHVMNIYDKVGVESRAGLALLAMEHQLFDEAW